MKTQFITDQSGKKLGVLLSMSDYEKLLNDADEKEAIKKFDKITSGKMEFMDARNAFAQMNKKSSAKK